MADPRRRNPSLRLACRHGQQGLSFSCVCDATSCRATRLYGPLEPISYAMSSELELNKLYFVKRLFGNEKCTKEGGFWLDRVVCIAGLPGLTPAQVDFTLRKLHSRTHD